MFSIDTDHSGFIDFKEFRKRFSTTFEHIKEIKPLIREIGRKIRTKDDEDIKSLFNNLDQNKDGLLDFKEFCAFLNNIESQSENAKRYSNSQKREIWKILDSRHKGHLTFHEFVAAFVVQDKKATATWASTITEKILHEIRKHSSELKAIFRGIDVDHSGFIDMQEFHDVLKEMNSTSFKNKVTTDQITKLFETLDTKKNGCIDYETFLDGLKIKDETKHKFVHTLNQIPSEN